MKIQQTLRRPQNWQDFERLCKLLWAEIWDCPEIQWNGRSGQKQQGVDIFGIPKGEKSFYGIQCKGKSEYTSDNYKHKQFSIKEVDKEIENAKSFKPPLKKLYLVTTAQNDVKIQEYVRNKNVENQELDLFEVHLFSWEAIVDLLESRPTTLNYYLNNSVTSKSIQSRLTFQDDSTHLNQIVLFKQNVQKFCTKAPEQTITEKLNLICKSSNFIPNAYLRNNKSLLKFRFRLHNDGTDSIEKYKLKVSIDGNFLHFHDSLIDNTFANHPHYFREFEWLEPQKSFVLKPENLILVGGDNYLFTEIQIKPLYKNTELKIRWELLADGYRTSGELFISIQVEIRQNISYHIVNNAKEIKTEYGKIEDFLDL